MTQVWNRVKGWLQSDLPWWLLVGLGAALRLRQYAANRSLWADEASLAVNLASRTFGELTQLLDYHQAAPVGFLFIEKFFVVTLGNYDYIMRLFPLLSGLLALYLVYRIGRAHFGAAGLFAVAMFAVSFWLVYYSSELKQYSSDVMAAALLVFLAGRCLGKEARGRDFLLLGAIGSLLVWVSHPSVFVMPGIGLALLYEKFFRKGAVPLAWIAGMGGAWLVSFGLEYFISLRHIVADGYLVRYWQKAYMPMPPWNNLGWFVKTYNSFLYIGFHTHWIMSIMFIALVCIGALSLFARNRSLALIMTLPFFITLCASALQKYPLMHRFLIFLVPLALFLMAEGMGLVYRFFAIWNRCLALVSWVLPTAIIVGMIAPFTFSIFVEPIRGSDIKPVLEYVTENKRQDDTVYVFHSADPAFNYYAPFYGLDPGNIIIGFETTRKKVALRRFYEDVENLRGNDSVWFIFSDIADCGGCEGNMQAFYVDYLNQYGTMLDSFGASGANAYLYDLSP